MNRVLLKVAAIGNSRGVRIPAAVLRRYAVGDRVIMEERSDGILLRPERHGEQKLSWADTAHAMAAQSEDWGDLNHTMADGRGQVPWEWSAHLEPVKRVAEPHVEYASPKPKSKRRKT